MTRTPPPAWLWALAGLTGLGALFRFWRLDSLPPGYWYDEAHKSLVAFEILRGLRAPLYVTDGSGLEAGYFWLLAAWFRVFGPDYFASRALSALLGTLTVPLLFWAVRELYRRDDPRRAEVAALLAAAVLSLLLWHVHWSRLGLETILVPLASAGLLGLTAWAWNRPSWARFALLGLALGLSQYTNPGARVLPLQAALTFALLAHGSRRTALGWALVAGGATVAAYAPLGVFFLNNPEWFVNRIAFVSTQARAGGLAFYLDSALKTLLSLNFRGDNMVRHNLAGRPALDPVASFWMAAGLAAILRAQAARRAHLALLAALGVNLLPMVFSDGAPGFGRTLGAAPLLAALPAFGLARMWEWGAGRQWARGLAAASLLASLGTNAYDYFARYPRQPGLFDAFEVGLWRLTRAAARGAQEGTGYLVLDEAAMQHPAVRLTRELDAPRGDLRLVNAQACWVVPETPQRPVTFAALAQWSDAMLAEFPGASVEPILHEPEVYLYGAVLSVPAESRSRYTQPRPLAAFEERFELLNLQAPAEPVAPGSSVELSLAWRALRSDSGRFTVFVHLVNHAEPFWGGVDGEPCQGWYPTHLWRAGEVVRFSLTLALPPDLPPGEYALAVGMYDTESGRRLPVSRPAGPEPDRVYAGGLIVE